MLTFIEAKFHFSYISKIFIHYFYNFYISKALIYFNSVCVISFLVFAYLNFNDPDWYLWVPIYLSAAGCCGFALAGLTYPTIYQLLMSFYLIYALLLFFQKDGVRDWILKYHTPSLVETMQTNKPYIEKTREFFGLLIITSAVFINYLSL